ncbi:MAG: hypothetical protein ACR2NZ_03185 [Rubripirellula sp.]
MSIVDVVSNDNRCPGRQTLIAGENLSMVLITRVTSVESRSPDFIFPTERFSCDEKGGLMGQLKFLCIVGMLCLSPGTVALAENDDTTDQVNRFLARVEQADPIVLSNERTLPRIVRDDAGKVVKLELTEIDLSPQDWQALVKIHGLERLVLRKTNVTDDRVRQLRSLTKLRWLNLCSTEITDGALKTIAEFQSLRALCLADVRVSREAVDELKRVFKEREIRLGIGYRARKQP